MDAMLTTAWDRKNLLQLEGMGRDDLVEVLDLAQSHLDVVRGKSPSLDTLAGRIAYRDENGEQHFEGDFR